MSALLKFGDDEVWEDAAVVEEPISIEASKYTCEPGEVVSLSAVRDSVGFVENSFLWWERHAHGTFNATDVQEVSWTAPEELGTHVIYVSYGSNPSSADVDAVVQIVVKNAPPSVKAVWPSENKHALEIATESLSLNFAAEILPFPDYSSVKEMFDGKIKFTVDDLGISSTWSPGPVAIIDEDDGFFTPMYRSKVKYSGWPESGSSFGKKTATMTVDGCSSLTETYEFSLYFDPNYHDRCIQYWGDVKAVPDLEKFHFDSLYDYGGGYLGHYGYTLEEGSVRMVYVNEEFVIGPAAFNLPADYDFLIAFVAGCVAHEMKHKSDADAVIAAAQTAWDTWWSTLSAAEQAVYLNDFKKMSDKVSEVYSWIDEDGDGIPNDIDEVVDIPDKDGVLNSEQAESLCDAAMENAAYDSKKDWSKGGAQW